jgi:hypothetical protein
MRRPAVLERRASALLAAGLLLGPTAPALARAGTVAARFRSSPWATINACDPPGGAEQVGVRASVPNRADAAQWVRIRIEFFDRRRRSWRVVRTGGDTGFRRLSRGGGRILGGTTFTITPPGAGRSVTLRGLVDVQWRRGLRVLSSAQVTTHGGHLDGNDPLLQVSARTCVIRR